MSNWEVSYPITYTMILEEETAGVVACTAAGQYHLTRRSLSLAFAIFVCIYFFGGEKWGRRQDPPAHSPTLNNLR